MTNVRRLTVAATAVLCFAFVPRHPAAQMAGGRLTIDTLIDIKHPSSPVWSPDSRRVAFVWERAGVQNVWVADPSAGASAPRALSRYGSGTLGGLFWSRDGRHLYFSRNGDLWAVDPDGAGEPRAVWPTPLHGGNVVPSPDGTMVAFVRGGDVWTRSFSDGHEVRVTRTPVQERGLSWSPDGARIAYTTSTSKRVEEAPEYSGSKILFTHVERHAGDVYVSPAGGGPATAVVPDGTFREYGVSWLNATHVVFQRVSDDTTRRDIVVADATTGRGEPIVREVDPKWWSIPFQARPGPSPSPDGKWVLFVSDRDGWDHVYVVPAAGGAPVQLTHGTFEAWRPAWSPDGTRIAFDANSSADPGRRALWVADLTRGPAAAALHELTEGRGTNIQPAWSPDGRRLVYQHTDPENSADLYVVAETGAPAPVRVTSSFPPGIDRSGFVAPRFVHYRAADGQEVPAWLFVPKNLDRTKKHPAIIWIHGDGINQNFDGWHVERNYAVYYSFHQYLLQQGYVVLAPDYRGSIGYGRAWRQGVFLDAGGQDAQDTVEGVKYLASLGYVDTSRIGVWGLSYGGFFTLLDLVNAPTTFACGVDVAGVVDYRMYYEDPWHGSWTYGRLRAPEDNPKAYDVASPLMRIDRLQRPLLILHGTADVNVPFIESVRLIDALLKDRKQFDFMIYPGEFHYFTREHVLRDAWHRVDRFFATHLKGEE